MSTSERMVETSDRVITMLKDMESLIIFLSEKYPEALKQWKDMR